MDKSLANLDQSCPAFSEGCPYAHPHSEDDAKARVDSTAKCPAFSDGCPFAKATDAAALSKMLETVPDSHKVGGQLLGSVSALHAIMSGLHERSKQTKTEVGADCPIFSNACPFKNLTSSGSPLVAELEYRTWSVFSIEETEQEEPKEKDVVLLSKNLKEGTRKSHRAAENVQFVRNFIKGKIDREAYKHMIVSLWHVYTALEDELRKNASHPTFGALHFPDKLERQASLEEDLLYFFGDDSWRKITPSACTTSYVERIRQVGQNSPELLVAHAYTRYLGDLSGGKVLMRVAKKAMGLPKGNGVKFYEFENIDNGRTFKKMCKFFTIEFRNVCFMILLSISYTLSLFLSLSFFFLRLIHTRFALSRRSGSIGQDICFSRSSRSNCRRGQCSICHEHALF
jgi:heme oxygenase